MSARTDHEHRVVDAAADAPTTEAAQPEASSLEAPAPAASGPDAPVGMRGVHTLSMAKAITAGLREALRADDKVLLMGEDIGPLGGVFRVTEGLQAEFGTKRVLDTPLAESGIVG
ncbi:MAG TPA: hypothetical protein VI121_02810, partial [Agromyces sp.]